MCCVCCRTPTLTHTRLRNRATRKHMVSIQQGKLSTVLYSNFDRLVIFLNYSIILLLHYNSEPLLHLFDYMSY